MSGGPERAVPRCTAPAALMGLLLFAVSPCSFGGGSAPGNLVFDPSNFARNTVSATQAVRAEVQRAQQLLQQAQAYVLQLRQYAAMVQQLKSLNRADIAWLILQSNEDLRRFSDYAQSVDALYGDLKGLRSEIDRQFLRKERSGLTWSEYVQREGLLGRLRQAGNDESFRVARDLMGRVQRSVEQVRTLQERIPQSAGTHEAVQLLDEHLGVLVTEQAALLAYFSTKGMAESEERRQAEQARATSLARTDARSARAEAAAAQLDGELQSRRERLREIFDRRTVAP